METTMLSRIKRTGPGACAAVLLILLFSAGTAAAAALPGVDSTGRIKDLEVPLAQDSGVTYQKLVAGVFKGVSRDAATGELVTAADKTLRRLGEKERTVVPAGTGLSEFSAFRVRGDNRTYIVLLLAAAAAESDIPGGGAAVLAVFPEGSAEPQDVADVKLDRSCSRGLVFSLGNDDAFEISNSHHNSSQGYLITTLLHIRGGRFRKIAEVLTLSVNSGECKTSFTEDIAWSTEPEAGGPYPAVVAKVTLTTGAPEGGTCTSAGKFRRSIKTYSETYRWSSAKERFIPDGKGFKELDRFNQRNF